MGGICFTHSEPKGFAESAHGSSERSTNRKGQVIEVHSSSNWKQRFEASKNTSTPMVVHFTASWPGPCRSLLPAVNDFAEKYKNVDFINIDVNELLDVADEFGVFAMPTCILIKNGEEKERVVGAREDDLQKMIEPHRDIQQ